MSVPTTTSSEMTQSTQATSSTFESGGFFLCKKRSVTVMKTAQMPSQIKCSVENIGVLLLSMTKISHSSYQIATQKSIVFQILICRRGTRGSAPAPRELLKKFNQNFWLMATCEFRVILDGKRRGVFRRRVAKNTAKKARFLPEFYASRRSFLLAREKKTK